MHETKNILKCSQLKFMYLRIISGTEMETNFLSCCNSHRLLRCVPNNILSASENRIIEAMKNVKNAVSGDTWEAEIDNFRMLFKSVYQLWWISCANTSAGKWIQWSTAALIGPSGLGSSLRQYSVSRVKKFLIQSASIWCGIVNLSQNTAISIWYRKHI